MLKKLEAFLDSITMYRLVVYILGVIVTYSFVLSLFGLMSFSPLEAAVSLVVIFATCILSNSLLSWIFSAAPNVESSAITSLILYLIIEPTKSFTELKYLFLAGLIATSSKYLATWNKKHIFNPVAISLFVLGVFGFGGGIWWVGSVEMLPVVLFSLLIVIKLRRKELLISFLVASVGAIILTGVASGNKLPELLVQVFTSWPIVFFAGVMLTEPLTSPNRKVWQTVFGVLVGVLFGLRFSVGPVYSSPEFALLAGNLLAFFVTVNARQKLKLKSIEKLSESILEFVFEPTKRVNFLAGQYAEVTLPHSKSDNRGNRRYFTISSSPSENDIRFCLRIDKERSSSFKDNLQHMKTGDVLTLTQIGGDFVLPKSLSEKLIFVAGGVGITPFVSMVRSLLLKNERRDVVLIYLVHSIEEASFMEVFKDAKSKMDFKIVLVNSSEGDKFNTEVLRKEVSDLSERVVYISGSNSVVEMGKAILAGSGVAKENIRTDYFAGY